MASTAVAQRKPQERSQESVLGEIIASYKGKPGALLGVLEKAQGLERFKYLSEPTLRQIAEGMEIPFPRYIRWRHSTPSST